MSDFLISVIVPCYNVEKYVARCIDSLIAQSIGFENIQLILVNDASTDNTLQVLKKYEAQYPDNIMVITYEQNMRQGAARNIGLEYAMAPYVGYIDSDDWIDPPMYKEMYDIIQSSDYDVVRCKTLRDASFEITHFDIPSHREDQDLTFELCGDYYWGSPDNDHQGVNGTIGGIVTGLYKKELLTEHNIYFPVGITYEDNYWNSLMRFYIRRMYILDIPYYHYYINPDSTITRRNSVHHFDRIEIEEMLFEEYSSRNVFDCFYHQILIDSFTRYYLNSMYMFFSRFDDNLDVAIYNRISSNIYKYFPNWRNDFIEDGTDLTSLLTWWLDKYPQCSQDMLNLLRNEYLKLLGE